MTEREFKRGAMDLREDGHLRRPALKEGAALDSETIALFDWRDRFTFWRGHRDAKSKRGVSLLSETSAELRHVTARFVTGAGHHDRQNETGGKPCIPRQ